MHTLTDPRVLALSDARSIDVPNLEMPLLREHLDHLHDDDAAWTIAEQSGRYVILDAAGDPIHTDPAEVRRFVLNNHPQAIRLQNAQEAAMTNTDTTYDIRRMASGDYDSAAAFLARHDPSQSPVALMIGSKAVGVKQAREIGKAWSQLDGRGANGFGLGYVSLDTDPEVRGVPRQMRPGVPMLKLIECPDFHPLYAGPGSMLVVYYQPVTTWTSRRTELDRFGRPVTVETELASGNDPSGYVAVTEVIHLTPEGVDEWLSAVRDAVRTLSLGEPGTEDADEAEAERDAQRLDDMRKLLGS